MTDKPRNTQKLFDVPPLPVGTWLDPALPMSFRGDAKSDALLTPARRAGIMMFVLAALMLAISIGLFAFGYSLPGWLSSPRAPEITAQLRDFQAKAKLTDQQLNALSGQAIIYSFVVAGVAAVFLLLAPFVLRGARIAIIMATVLAAGATMCMLLTLVDSLAIGQAGSTIIVLIVVAAFCVLLMWLWRALRAASTLRKNWADSQRHRWALLDQQQSEPPGFMAYHAVPRPARQTSFSPTSSLRPK
jgi:hypothetical protein